MSFEQFFDASMRVGLNRAEAEEQVKKAKDAGYLSDDPYLLPFIAEGLLLRAARLNFKALQRFESLKHDYADAVAVHVADSITPVVAFAASTAFEGALYSPQRRAKRLLLIGVLCGLVGSCGFLVGSVPRLQIEGSLAAVADGDTAAAWSDIIRYNSHLPGVLARCQSDAKYQTRDSVGTLCTIQIYSSKLEQPPSSWSWLFRLLWLGWLSTGAAAAAVVFLSRRVALRLFTASRAWVLGLAGVQPAFAEDQVQAAPTSRPTGTR